ncbi:UNVERIFIED_CONTAM: hypothetical protein Slati_0457700 [Sesamum latifolium]|uniref:Uncharacterized protein n=1 Tax=Sesamum latifolium TaxID=2727402 RepID=A0AAW2XWE3_9LAMI
MTTKILRERGPKASPARPKDVCGGTGPKLTTKLRTTHLRKLRLDPSPILRTEYPSGLPRGRLLILPGGTGQSDPPMAGFPPQKDSP